MSIYIDEEKKEIYLSVGDIISTGEKVKIGFSANEGYERLWVGQSLHSQYYEEEKYKDETFEKEYFIKYEIELKGWKVIIQGRIDCLRRKNGSLILEEVKTLYFSKDLPAFYDSQTFEIYKKQTKVYSYLLSTIEKRNVIGRIVLLDIGTFQKKIIEVEADNERIEAFILNKIKKIISSFEKEKEKIKAQRDFAKEIKFIHSKYRPFQKEFIEEIDYALRNKKNILISAPTGLGKTVSAITPSIKFCLEKNLRLFFLTSKTLQQDMAVDVIKKINKEGIFYSIQIRAKDKMCPSLSYLCHEKFCIYAKDYGKKKEESKIIQKFLSSFSHFDPDIIYKISKEEEICPFEVSLELMGFCKFIVCDYNYIFDPFISFFNLKEENSLSTSVLIIDEAHNLVERGRGYWSCEIKKEDFEKAKEEISMIPQEFSKIILNALEIVLNYFHRLQKNFERDIETLIDLEGSTLREAYQLLESQVLEYFLYIKEKEIFLKKDDFLEIFFDFSKFIRILDFFSSKFKVIYKKKNGDQVIKIFCLDPSKFIGEVISNAYSVIAMSATLTPQYFYKKILGFPNDKTIEATFPSPFPKENRKIMIYPFINTTYKKRKEEAKKLANLIYETGNSINGNFLVLFPSYEYLNEVLNYYPAGGKIVLIQEKDQDLIKTRELVKKIKKGGGDYLFFGVSGGLFAEGVDYPDEVLKGVFIISPSLPQLSLEQELLREYYDQEEENGFSFSYIIPGITRVIQSAGRVIRSEKDRGVVLLICKRFSEEIYSRYLPSYWYEKSIKELIVEDPKKEIIKFFGGKIGKKKASLNS